MAEVCSLLHSRFFVQIKPFSLDMMTATCDVREPVLAGEDMTCHFTFIARATTVHPVYTVQDKVTVLLLR